MMIRVSISSLTLASVLVTLRAENDYQRLSRAVHNGYRQKHHVGDLESSDDMNNRAVQCANYYASKRNIDHSCPYKNGAGENLWAQIGGLPSGKRAARGSTNAWYRESSKYDYKKDYQPRLDHFSQLVWKNSTQFGFGSATNGTFTSGCALYYPAGNVIGKFKENVFPS